MRCVNFKLYLAFMLALATGVFADEPPIIPLAFPEIWAYVLTDEQGLVLDSLPVSDLAYFAAGINNRGELFGGGATPSKSTSMKMRRHLVLADLSSSGVIHFVLAPEFPLRDKLIKDLVEKAKDYDGVQIDFEAIAAYDKTNFLQFLTLLKAQLPDKILSVALPARNRTLGDAFDYASIAVIVDRVFIMAYDEHWSGSKPGSIASLAWCKEVAEYAQKIIGTDKLVMGMPFYGRVWGEKNPVGAHRFSSMERIQKENATTAQRDSEGIPYFNFSTTTNYTAYYEDAASIHQRAVLYQNAQVVKIGFWRLGQEDPSIWSAFKIGEIPPPSPSPSPANQPPPKK